MRKKVTLTVYKMGEVIVLRPDEERLYQGQPKGFPFGDFALEDVMLPEDDDLGVDSDEDDINEEEIVTESGFGSVIGMLPVTICSLSACKFSL